MPFIAGIFPRLFKASAFINIMLYPNKKKTHKRWYYIHTNKRPLKIMKRHLEMERKRSYKYKMYKNV
jgi:hypothetical protein